MANRFDNQSGQGFTPNKKQPEVPKDPGLPTQDKVAQSHAMVRTETGIKGMKHLAHRYETVAIQSFDMLMDEADSRITQHIAARMGVSHSFFDFDVETAFDSLMPAPRTSALPASTQTIDIQVLPQA